MSKPFLRNQLYDNMVGNILISYDIQPNIASAWILWKKHRDVLCLWKRDERTYFLLMENPAFLRTGICDDYIVFHFAYLICILRFILKSRNKWIFPRNVKVVLPFHNNFLLFWGIGFPIPYACLHIYDISFSFKRHHRFFANIECNFLTIFFELSVKYFRPYVKTEMASAKSSRVKLR